MRKMPPSITPEQRLKEEAFAIWMEHPVTLAVFAKLRDKLAKIDAEWHNMSFKANIEDLQSGKLMYQLAHLQGKREFIQSMVVMKAKHLVAYTESK